MDPLFFLETLTFTRTIGAVVCYIFRWNISSFYCVIVYYVVFTDITYDRICEKEPIGRELFMQFCEQDEQLKFLLQFLKSVVSTSSPTNGG